MPTPPQHRLDQTGRDARGRLPLVRPPSTPIHSIDRPNTHPMTPIHLMDRPNPPPERQPKRRRTWTPPTRHRTWPTGAHPPTMQIFAKTLIGKTITIDVEDTDNSTIIKRKIEFKTKVPIDKFHLLLRGKPWGDDNSTVSDYDIQKDDTVRMVAGLFAGMKRSRSHHRRQPRQRYWHLASPGFRGIFNLLDPGFGIQDLMDMGDWDPPGYFNVFEHVKPFETQ
jgi:hypothetical protein